MTSNEVLSPSVTACLAHIEGTDRWWRIAMAAARDELVAELAALAGFGIGDAVDGGVVDHFEVKRTSPVGVQLDVWVAGQGAAWPQMSVVYAVEELERALFPGKEVEDA